MSKKIIKSILSLLSPTENLEKVIEVGDGSEVKIYESPFGYRIEHDGNDVAYVSRINKIVKEDNGIRIIGEVEDITFEGLYPMVEEIEIYIEKKSKEKKIEVNTIGY